MEYEISKFNENTWVISEGFVRMFLLVGEKEALLIDTGMNVKKAKETAQKITDLPVKLINTHADPDHIGSNDSFDEFYMHSAEEENYRQHGGKGKYIPVKENDILDLGNRQVKIIELPGHTPGSIGILDIKNMLLFSGDTVQKNSQIFMFGPQRDLSLYKNTLEKLIELSSEFEQILASHGDLPLTPAVLPGLLEGTKKVISGEIKGTAQTMPFGGQVTACNIGEVVLLVQ